MSPGWVGFWLGVFLGCNGGILIAAILAANARQAACEEAYRAGHAKALEQMEMLRRRYAERMDDDIAASFPRKPQEPAA